MRRIGSAGRFSVLVVVLVLPAATTSGNVFEMGPGLTSLETVPIGNPRNAADDEVMNDGTRGYGSVDYEYNVGKYEVTAAQYCEFLNAVARTDTHGLYNTEMWLDTHGCKIQRMGDPGSYSYTVASPAANRPVNWVSWGDAARFANWLHNGQPTGSQDLTTTEDGAYYLNGAIGDVQLRSISRGSDWRWAIASENEWYKSAYYKGSSTDAGYFLYPTSSDSMPGWELGDSSGNNANHLGGNFPISPPYYTTVVGEFQDSESPYGTFDQGGNVYEWTEAAIGGRRVLRGGSFGTDWCHLQAVYRQYLQAPSYETDSVGFRLVEVPEPTCLTVLILAGTGVLLRRRV